jgi:hypothetical protein
MVLQRSHKTSNRVVILSEHRIWHRCFVSWVNLVWTLDARKHIFLLSLSFVWNRLWFLDGFKNAVLLAHDSNRHFLELLREIERRHDYRIFRFGLVPIVKGSLGYSKSGPVKCFCKNSVALRPLARLLRLDLSLVLTAFALENTKHRFVIRKFIDVWSLHVFVFNIFVIWLELGLNSRHLCSDFKLFFRMKLGFQVLTHVARIFWLKNLLVHVSSLFL